MFGIAKSKIGTEQSAFPRPGNNRRALGDITNSIVEECKDVPKKYATTNFAQPTALARASHDSERAYMQRSCDDIDERDCDNPLLVTEYVNDMYEHFSDAEAQFMVAHSYMNRQEFVNERMRAILVDWLVCLTLKTTSNQ